MITVLACTPIFLATLMSYSTTDAALNTMANLIRNPDPGESFRFM